MAGHRPLARWSIVCGVAVLREGSEVVLFLYGIAASGGTSAADMMPAASLGCSPAPALRRSSTSAF